jgi:hypothetical protein
VTDPDVAPAGFFGHGSPMNTLERNRYTAAWRAFGTCVERPRAVLVISAHWYTNATAVTAMAQPRTIPAAPNPRATTPPGAFRRRYRRTSRPSDPDDDPSSSVSKVDAINGPPSQGASDAFSGPGLPSEGRDALAVVLVVPRMGRAFGRVLEVVAHLCDPLLELFQTGGELGEAWVGRTFRRRWGSGAIPGV